MFEGWKFSERVTGRRVESGSVREEVEEGVSDWKKYGKEWRVTVMEGLSEKVDVGRNEWKSGCVRE